MDQQPTFREAAEPDRREAQIFRKGGDPRRGEDDVDRDGLLRTFRAYLAANELEADWESVSRAENAMLVNALSMMSPYGAPEKQALLEAKDLKTRAEILIAVTEMDLAKKRTSGDTGLQ